MNFKDITPQVFDEMPRGGKINARRLELNRQKDFGVFIFSERSDSFQCIFSVNDTRIELPSIAGLQIKYEAYMELGGELKPYILLECNTPAYLKQFTEIIKDIITEFESGQQEISRSVIHVIEKWRHFFSLPRIGLLSEDEILGLLGELVLLKSLILDIGMESLQIWKADRGGEDFIGKDVIVEVKSSLNEKHQHIINGIDQLKVLPGFEKYVLSFLFVKEENEPNLTIPSLLSEIRTKLKSNPLASDSFYQKLRARGYDVRDEASYSTIGYRCLRSSLFHVNEDFPRLTTDLLRQPLNPRISRIRYTIDLEGLSGQDFTGLNLRNVFPNGM